MQKISILLIIGLFYFQSFAQNNPQTEGNTMFATNLYHQIKTEPVNLFYSPFSISSALAMTYAGAKNETLNQMSKTLYFPKNQVELHTNFNALINSLVNNESDGVQLKIANSIWLQETMKINDEFLSINEKYYNAGIMPVNFLTDPEKSRLKINNWVEKNTNDKITDLLPDGSIHSETRLVLVNAIYFKGRWDKIFDKNLNTEEVFYVYKTCQTQATYMNNYINTMYFEDNLLSIVEIPYTGQKQSLLIILPKERYGLKDVEKVFEQKSLTEYFNKMIARRVNLSIPKFKTEATYDLKNNLSKMGMPVAFTNNADFSGITGEKSLAIDKIIHKAYIDVNEEGTEAAAATAVSMRKTSAMLDEVKCKADHPFIYLIRDNQTGTILFIGRLMNPNQ
jgi:serpin B